MKIGGNGEFWMVVGPIVAVALIATYVAGSPAGVELRAQGEHQRQRDAGQAAHSCVTAAGGRSVVGSHARA